MKGTELEIEAVIRSEAMELDFRFQDINYTRER
jgi:hypothetical protein